MKLLELLKSKRRKTWQQEADRELETAAAESYLVADKIVDAVKRVAEATTTRGIYP